MLTKPFLDNENIKRKNGVEATLFPVPTSISVN